RAGLQFYPVVQEPIAAGMAFGFHNSGDNGRWIVCDLGAGTLDVSLLIRRHGLLEVPLDADDGDPELGGKDLDRILAEYWLHRCEAKYKVDRWLERISRTAHESREQTTDHEALALLYEIEQAKIQLSEENDADFAPQRLRDDTGRIINVVGQLV